MGMRIERAAATIVAQQANMHRKQGAPAMKVDEFMPHADKPEMTLEQAMEMYQ
ncbi:phage tail assembly protein T [Vreelandella aquamarina]|uniref:phage tail assembly protein T n=1 Tax=Vreelandella aquamarina TaxID=77097 RepID=UPI0019680F68|nr:hypothetical protein [Halomonas meridiana]